MSKAIAIKSLLTLIDAQSMATDLTSETINLNSVEGYSVQFSWSAGAAPVGLVKLQGSNLEDDANFIDIDDSTVNLNGSSGNIMMDVATHSYKFVKALYVRTSGSGTMTITAVARSRA